MSRSASRNGVLMIDGKPYVPAGRQPLPSTEFQGALRPDTTYSLRLTENGSVYISQRVKGHEGSQWVCLSAEDLPALAEAIRLITPDLIVRRSKQEAPNGTPE